jgi:hypothetical protein
MSDLYDALERRHEAHERAAAEMAAVLGVAKDPAAKPRDEGAGPGYADAGERTQEPTPTGGESSAAKLRDFLLYDEAGWPRR